MGLDKVEENKCGKISNQKTVALNAKNYYPVSSKLLNAIEFKVKGKTKSDKSIPIQPHIPQRHLPFMHQMPLPFLILLMILAQIKVHLLGIPHTRQMMQGILQGRRYRPH